MENTSTISKRRSLTLSTRLLQKRHSASPQNCVRASATHETGDDEGGSPCSPRVSIRDNVESTPPNRRMHTLDDSLEFSPRNSLSPSCLFSQTLVSGSPEVGWRWNSDENTRGDRVNTTSDSGFDSEEFGLNAHKQRERRKQVRADAANERKRKQFDNRQWRAQQKRDHELLRERCDKLHRQLDQQMAEPETTDTVVKNSCITASTDAAADPALADFLNDSDMDCFLLEATQKVESKLEVPNKTPAVATPPSHFKKEKENRCSFYMKFLEDESESEDWFAALDEAMLEATQPKKARTALQRYKSMPSKTVDDGASTHAPCSSSSADTPRIKRHSSTHALSPATSNARNNLFGRRQ